MRGLTEEDESQDLFEDDAPAHLSRAQTVAETEPGRLRMVEALLFAAAEPLDEASLAERLPEGSNIAALLEELRALYAARGVNLIQVADKWSFRTAPDLAFLLDRERVDVKRLSKAASEALAIIAYQPKPVTRAEIEEIRGVALSKGTLDVLIETGWVRPRGRRDSVGRPMTYGVSEDFLIHFGLNDISDLPGLEELRAAGLFEPNAMQAPLLPGLGASDQAKPDEPEDESRAEEQAERAAADFEADEALDDPGTS